METETEEVSCTDEEFYPLLVMLVNGTRLVGLGQHCSSGDVIHMIDPCAIVEMIEHDEEEDKSYTQTVLRPFMKFSLDELVDIRAVHVVACSTPTPKLMEYWSEVSVAMDEEREEAYQELVEAEEDVSIEPDASSHRLH